MLEGGLVGAFMLLGIFFSLDSFLDSVQRNLTFLVMAIEMEVFTQRENVPFWVGTTPSLWA